jgi:uncharacterized repeat protein (TIGR01451 family)
LGSGGATTCENFADNQAGDPTGVIEVLATPISAAPTTITSCNAARASALKRNFSEIDISGDVLNFKAWNIDEGGENPALLDSLTINKTVIVEPTPITLTKTVDKSTAKSGDLLNYTISYISGNQTYTDINLADQLPAGTDFVSATGGGQLINNIITWHFNDFSPGERGSFNVQVRVK